MSAIEGKLILDALNEIEEPARFMDIVDYIKDKNDCPISVKTIEKTVQSALDAGVRYGFIQRDADYYYSEAQVLKKLDDLDNEDDNLEDNEIHIFKRPREQTDDMQMGNSEGVGGMSSACDDMCHCITATEDLETNRMDQVKKRIEGEKSAASIQENGTATAKSSTTEVHTQDAREWTPPKEKKSRLSLNPAQSKHFKDSQQSSEDGALQSCMDDLGSVSSLDVEDLTCTECGRCKGKSKNRKRRARGKSRKRGCGNC